MGIVLLNPFLQGAPAPPELFALPPSMASAAAELGASVGSMQQKASAVLLEQYKSSQSLMKSHSGDVNSALGAGIPAEEAVAI